MSDLIRIRTRKPTWIGKEVKFSVGVVKFDADGYAEVTEGVCEYLQTSWKGQAPKVKSPGRPKQKKADDPKEENKEFESNQSSQDNGSEDDPKTGSEKNTDTNKEEKSSKK